MSLQKTLIVETVSKSFNGVSALRDCSIDAGAAEIIALLGPSGCGKTTLLNLIAGFGAPDTGRIYLGGKDITATPAYRRSTGMVFQQYALFPHMTARKNILYGPSVQGIGKREAGLRADEVAALLRIDHLMDRYPTQLSGGQRQRVAIARALATRPEILLLDEAFSALDRSLREEMQIELALLLRKLGITTILVTHDQREAFALADRVAVMDSGAIRQFASPDEVYRRPAAASVFEFFGTTNHLPGIVQAGTGSQKTIRLAGVVDIPYSHSGLRASQIVEVGIRAEDVAFLPTPTAMHAASPFTVSLSRFLGQTTRVVAELDGVTVIGEGPSADGYLPQSGDKVFLQIRPGAARLTDQPWQAA